MTGKVQVYETFSRGIQRLLEEVRRQAVRSVNSILTAAYWETGRRIVVFEQGGNKRASYGAEIVLRLSKDLTQRFGRGFGVSHVKLMRQFYLAYPDPVNRKSAIGRSRGPQKGKSQSVIGQSSDHASWHQADITAPSQGFPLSWTNYVRLLRVKNEWARSFYETEAVRGDWSMLAKSVQSRPGDELTPEEEIKNPYVLEFLGLKDEYSESDLEESLIRHLETFLLELGGDFTFVARQKRLRIDNSWYRVDLVFYHRKLRCLMLVDLKLDHLTHADAGQMHMYLNYARENWTHPDENPPVGLILCAEKGSAVAHYSLEGLPNKILAAEYKTTLPDERKLAEELKRTQLAFDTRIAVSGKKLKKGSDADGG